eukprot:SAG31_NODE_4899_length_2878_cov_1.365599_4_plen_146_part_00
MILAHPLRQVPGAFNISVTDGHRRRRDIKGDKEFPKTLQLETPERQDPIRLGTDNEHEVLAWSEAIGSTHAAFGQAPGANGAIDRSESLRAHLRDTDPLRPPGMKRGTVSYLDEVRAADQNIPRSRHHSERISVCRGSRSNQKRT